METANIQTDTPNSNQYDPICFAISAVRDQATSFLFSPLLTKEQQDRFKSMSFDPTKPGMYGHDLYILPSSTLNQVIHQFTHLQYYLGLSENDLEHIAEFVVNSVNTISSKFKLPQQTVSVTMSSSHTLNQQWHYDISDNSSKIIQVRLGIDLLGDSPTEFSQLEQIEFKEGMIPEIIHKPQPGEAAVWMPKSKDTQKPALHRSPGTPSDPARRRLFCLFDLNIPRQEVTPESIQNILDEIRSIAISSLRKTAQQIAEDSIEPALARITQLTEQKKKKPSSQKIFHQTEEESMDLPITKTNEHAEQVTQATEEKYPDLVGSIKAPYTKDKIKLIHNEIKKIIPQITDDILTHIAVAEDWLDEKKSLEMTKLLINIKDTFNEKEKTIISTLHEIISQKDILKITSENPDEANKAIKTTTTADFDNLAQGIRATHHKKLSQMTR